MMQGIRQWLLGVVLTSFAGGLACQIAPKGREQPLVRLVCGLLLILAVLRPLTELDWTSTAAFEADSLREQTADQTAAYRTQQQDILAAVIAEKTEAYICDKANRLGLHCTVRVTTAAGESGIPLPHTVAISGSYSGALAAYIEEEVGVPPEKQIWLEEKAWTETNGSES